jgi:uncharacterized tellurite resistance protein B-like protein
VLLSTEQNLITRLAIAWEVRGTGERLIDQTTVSMQEAPAWSMLHDISLMYVIVAHSTDNEISEAEITAMLARLSDWQPELEESEIRGVLREALGFYSRDPGQKALRHSVHNIRERLPVVHRLVLLDDLAFIAHADGDIGDNAKEMLGSLSKSWGIGVRVTGHDEEVV